MSAHRMACVVVGGIGGTGSAPTSRSATPASAAPPEQAARGAPPSGRDDIEAAEPEAELVVMHSVLPARHPAGNHITWESPSGARVLVRVPSDALPLSTIEFEVPATMLVSARGVRAAPDSPDGTDPPPVSVVFARAIGSTARASLSPGPSSIRVSPADDAFEVPALPRVALRHAGPRPRYAPAAGYARTSRAWWRAAAA